MHLADFALCKVCYEVSGSVKLGREDKLLLGGYISFKIFWGYGLC